jgi:hypothetical protein
MALILVATPGASDANTYCTLSDANTYFQSRLHKTAWEDAGSTEKNAALVWATRLLDELVIWNGSKTVDDGALKWPRSGVRDTDGILFEENAIPTWLEQATAEFAFHLLSEDRTLETNRDLKGLRKVSVDVISIIVDTKSMNSKKPTMPPSVWSIVKFYGKMYGQRKTLVRA